jgi:hypothetical protein
MKRIRNLLFGAGIFAALGFGLGAAQAEASPADQRRLCGRETSEGGCQSCCAYYGYGYFWDDELGCACDNLRR